MAESESKDINIFPTGETGLPSPDQDPELNPENYSTRNYILRQVVGFAISIPSPFIGLEIASKIDPESYRASAMGTLGGLLAAAIIYEYGVRRLFPTHVKK